MKLKPYEILEIVDDVLAGTRSVYRIAKEHKITPQWARRLAQRFRQTGQVPQARPCGRTPTPITAKEIEAVSEAYEIYHSGAVRLKKIMASQMQVEMSKRRIHQILRKLKLARRSYKKSKRRKWVRFERYNSNSLWHTDWTKIGRLWLIAFIDDASRFVVGWGLFKNATAANSVLVLERAIAAYGAPKAILTGHDVQFCSVQPKTGKLSEPNDFQKFLRERHIKHILGRVNHPQTNGKVERLFGTIKQKRKEFPSLEAQFHWYNHVRPHMSLKDELETPAEAYVRKMRSQKKIAVEVVVR
jgi:putative transposase